MILILTSKKILTTNHPNGLRSEANNFCFATGLDLCTSTNPYVNGSCAYGLIKDGVIEKKHNAKCPDCRCQIIEGTGKYKGNKACGIGKNDRHCNPSENQ